MHYPATPLQSLSSNPDRMEYQRAVDLLASGDKEAAFAILQRLVENNTELWEVYNDCGAMAVSEGAPEVAHDFFAKAVSCQGEHGRARVNLAIAEHMLGRPDGALATLSPMLRQTPNDPELLACVRKIVGNAPELSPSAWERLVMDLRSPTFDALVQVKAESQRLSQENAQLKERVGVLEDELRHYHRATKSASETGWDDINLLSDDEWLNVLIRSVDIPSYHGFSLPTFPSDGLQVGTVGSSNKAALNEGFNFYRAVKGLCEKHGAKLTPQTNLLDFGTGWGRYARIFTKDIRPEGIWGVDVDPALINICRNTFPYGTFETVPAFPPTQLPANHFGLVTAYSVFSHLSEAAATAWIREFARVLTPGGIIAITTQGRSFLEFCESIRNQGSDFEHPWHAKLAQSFVDRQACEDAYERGEFLYSATGGGDARPSSFYGEAIIPEKFVLDRWSQYLEPLEFLDDRSFLPQALIVMRKR